MRVISLLWASVAILTLTCVYLFSQRQSVREIVREVPKEIIRDVPKEVIRDVPKEIIVEKIVEKPVEVVRIVQAPIPDIYLEYQKFHKEFAGSAWLKDFWKDFSSAPFR